MLHARDLKPLLAAIVLAEQLARDGARRQARLAPPLLAQLLERQARQEAVHAATFETARALLPGNGACPPRLEQALGAYRARLFDDLDRARLADSLVGLQCVLEGLAGVALAPPPGELARLADRLVPLRPLVLHQEAAHHRLGEVWLPRLPGAGEAAVESARRRYAELAQAVLEAGLDTLDCLAADAAHYRRAVARQLAGLVP